MLIQGKMLNSADDLTEVYSIRRKVFIEEMGVNEDEVFDSLDQDSMHVLIFEEDPNWGQQESINANNKKAVATGRIYYDGMNCEISHVAVLNEYRGLKYGDFAVRMLLNKAFTNGVDEVSLISDLSVMGFFESIGFHKTEDNFMKNEFCKSKMIIRTDDLIKICNRSCKK